MREFFDELTHDHEEVKELLKKLNETSGSAVKTREKLFQQLKEELLPHMKAEEAAFYPVLKEKKEGRKVALEAVEEHALTENVFNQLAELPVQDEVWEAKMKVLKDLIDHHIEEEEEEVFEIAEDALEKEDFQKVLQNFNNEKEKVKKSIS